MNIWAIADLHLSYGTPNKKMDLFGSNWIDHGEKIAKHWRSKIKEEDLILIAGDISWAMKLEEAKTDLEWIDQLPGTKLMIKGNHDYWWQSISKVKKALPPSLHVIQNEAFNWNGVSIGGTRLWDDPELNFCEPKDQDQEKIFSRELQRLELSLKAIDPQAERKIVMTHYPPIDYNLERSRTSDLLERYKIDDCLFGHLHCLEQDKKVFGTRNGIRYILTACDYLNFDPIHIHQI